MNLRACIARHLGGLLAVLCLHSPTARAQWDVSIFMQPFPSPYLSDWEHNPTIGSLTITNNTSSPTDVIVNLTLSRNASGAIATGNSSLIPTSPGVQTQVNSDRFIDWNTVTYDASMRDQAVQTGRLPEGEYNACVTVKDPGGTILASNVCAPFTIVYPSPPSLFFPADGDSLDSMNPLFTWTPVQVPSAYQLRYVLRIVEILPGQTPHQALLANIVQYEENDLLTTNIQYPISALPLEPGKTYAWQVQAVDQNGFPPSGNQGRSEIWTFVTREVLGSQNPSIAPLTIEIVPNSTGSFSDFESSSFESAAQRLEPYNTTGGTIALPMSTTTGQSAIFDKIVIKAANRGIYIDRVKKSIAIKGGWTKTGRTYEVLFTAVWGARNDPRDKTLTLKGPLLSRIFPNVLSGLTEEYLMFSLADFDLKPVDLPDSVAGFFGAAEEVELKPGINFLGKFDLHRTPRLVNLMTMLGVEQPYVALKGHISHEVNWVFATGDSVSREKTLEMAVSGSIPLTRSLISWMPEADAELEIAWERKKSTTPHGPDSVEYKLSPKLTLQGKVTFEFLRDAERLNDTIEVKGSIALERPDSLHWIAELEVDDIIKFPKFENVFKFHDAKLEWDITKKDRVKLEGEFDFGRYEKVGTIEVEISRPDVRDTTGLRPVTNSTTGSPGSRDSSKVPFGGVPTPFKQAELLALMSKGSNEPLSGGKTSKKSEADTTGKSLKKWEVKGTAKFNQTALRAFSLPELIRTALNLGENLFGDMGDVNEFSRATRNSAPPPNYAPPEIPDFLSNLPALDELSISFNPGTLGSMVLRGRTSYNNSSTEIIVARAESATKKGFLLGLKPQNWSIENYFPNFSMPGLDSLTLSNVALVFSNVEGMMPSSELSDEEFEFYSAAYGKDEFMVVVKEGLNLIASIPGENLGSGGPLTPIMEKLGVERGNLLLQGSLGTRLQDIYLLAVFPSMSPPGAPSWFKSGEMAIELTGLPSIGLVGALAVTIEGDDVTFILKTKASAQGLILAGGMVSQEGWESPFGIEWLTLNRVMMLLGVTPTGSVQLGFNADMVVGTKDLDVAVLVALSPAGVPTNFMFDGESAAGFGVSDLVTLQQKIAAARSAGSPAIPLDNVPPLYIKDAKLKFAPKDSPELNISRGMTVAGLLELRPESGSTTKDLASAHFDVGDEGIIARGNIGAFTLGPVKLQEAALDLTLTRSEQYCVLTGQADLGFMRAGIDMNLTKTSAAFHADTRIFNAFEAELDANGALNLTQPAFVVKAKMKNDFNGAVAQQLRQAVKDIVTSKKNTAKSAADEAERKWQSAVDEREAAKSRWASLPLLPRDPKVAARERWEAAIAKALRLRTDKELKEGKERRWTLASNMLSQLEQQTGSGNFIVVRKAEFEADLANLKTGAVKKMAIDAKVGEREMDLQLSGWNFKNIAASVKGAAQNIADRLFDSFQ